MININNLTIDYGGGKGVKNVSFSVRKGQVVGYLGPNGAGKTTTIRAIMGFVKPDSGTVTVGGRDSFANSHIIMETLGYIPGEISFPMGMNARQLLDFTIKMRGGNTDKARLNYLIDFLELDLSGEISRFSKGMKQKLAIIIALMQRNEVLVLDEPSSGLDPLMQNKFIQLIEEEKAKNKAILLSSHIFEEIERTADEVIIIKDGAIKANASVEKLKAQQVQSFIVTSGDVESLQNSRFNLKKLDECRLKFHVGTADIDEFIKMIAQAKIDGFAEESQSLEQIFINYYKAEGEQNDI